MRELFASAGITCEIESNAPAFDASFVNDETRRRFFVLIPPADFANAREILTEHIRVVAESGDYEDHYFKDFSLEELEEVLDRQDEWSREDVLLARRILRDRGREYSDENLSQRQERRVVEYRQPRQGSVLWIILAILSSIVGGLALHPLAGFIGIVTGWYYWRDTTVGMDGNRFFTFDPTTRMLGKATIITGVIFGLIGLLNFMFLIWPTI